MMMFVNPKNDCQAVNLDNVILLSLEAQDIVFNDKVKWHFSNEHFAKEVYESIVRLTQENRYRKR